MSVPLEEWLRIFESEYLSDFIPSGGSTVKFLVVPMDEARRVTELLRTMSNKSGFVTAVVDSSETRVHMIDKLFCQAATQLNWTDIAELWLRRNLILAGYRVPDDRPISDLDALAEANGKDVQDIGPSINRVIRDGISRKQSLCGEFRNAVAALCVSIATPKSVTPEYAEALLAWLKGEPVFLSNLKRLRIYQKIARNNARAILISLARWLHDAGANGLTVVINLSSAFNDNPATQVRYSRATVLDLYETLRQFIDETDAMSFINILCVCGPGIIEDPKRNYKNYLAFEARVVSDVRDSERDNPLTTLVKVDSGPHYKEIS